MAISRIRGEQIKAKSILNEHVADNAAIEETKLAIDWANHYEQALITKKVVDFVQVNALNVGGVNQFDLTAIIPNTVPHVLSDPLSGEGVIVDGPKNIAPFRDTVTGDPVLDAEGKEVVAHVEFDENSNAFVLRFYDSTGAAFTMPANQTIDMQYAKRFNLDTVSEMFAANEKFVEGAADATAHLNITQLAKDLYGAAFSLDRDGNANLAISLVDQIANEIEARSAADQAIRDDLASTLVGKGASLIGVDDANNHFVATTVEGVLTEIASNLDTFKANLASTEVGQGASLVGLADAENKFTSTNVEGALEEVATRIENLELGSNAEVDAAKSRDAASANGYFAQENFASLEARLVDIETVVDAQEHDKEVRVTALETEVHDARGTADTLAHRLDAIEQAAANEAQAREDADAALDQRVKTLESEVTDSVSQLLADETTRAEQAEQNLQNALTAEVQRAEAAEQALSDRVHTLETEVTDNVSQLLSDETSRAEAAEQANAKAISDETTRAEAAESALSDRATSLENEVHAARGSVDSLDGRLDRALNEDGTLKNGKSIHDHFKAFYQATGGETTVALSAFNVANLPAYQVSDHSLDVYVNGILQNEGLHYAEVQDGLSVDFGMGDGTALVAGDVITIKYHINKAE